VTAVRPLTALERRGVECSFTAAPDDPVRARDWAMALAALVIVSDPAYRTDQERAERRIGAIQSFPALMGALAPALADRALPATTRWHIARKLGGSPDVVARHVDALVALQHEVSGYLNVDVVAVMADALPAMPLDQRRWLVHRWAAVTPLAEPPNPRDETYDAWVLAKKVALQWHPAVWADGTLRQDPVIRPVIERWLAGHYADRLTVRAAIAAFVGDGAAGVGALRTLLHAWAPAPTFPELLDAISAHPDVPLALTDVAPWLEDTRSPVRVAAIRLLASCRVASSAPDASDASRRSVRG
jgi:hypothetical protein